MKGDTENRMSSSEKIDFAREFYSKLNLVDQKIEMLRDNDLNADWIYIPNTRGPSSLIIADDGTFLVCPSNKGFEFCKEEFKNGKRSIDFNKAEFTLRIYEKPVVPNSEYISYIIVDELILKSNNGNETKKEDISISNDIKQLVLTEIDKIKNFDNMYKNQQVKTRKGGINQRLSIKIDNVEYSIFGNTDNKENDDFYDYFTGSVIKVINKIIPSISDLKPEVQVEEKKTTSQGWYNDNRKEQVKNAKFVLSITEGTNMPGNSWLKAINIVDNLIIRINDNDNKEKEDEETVNNIKQLVETNLEKIKSYSDMLKSGQVHTYKDSSQATLNIRLGEENYLISGKADNEKVVDLYKTIKNSVYDLVNSVFGDSKTNEKSLETIISEANNGDVYFTKLVNDYFIVELGVTEIMGKKLFSKVSKHKDIYNEFTKYLVQKTYAIENPINIEGYTAKAIAEIAPHLKGIGVYSFLVTLREKPEDAKRMIAEGFPRK